MIQYRGYSLDDLVGKYFFNDTAFLLIWGKLPTPEERAKLQADLNSVPLIEDSVMNVIRSFPYVSPSNSKGYKLIQFIDTFLAVLKAHQWV